MRRHVSLLRQMLHDYPARRLKIDIDGEEISDECILWEAMNIRSVGPVLYVASRAATKDGRLDFVCVRGKDRSLFMKYLGTRQAGGRAKFPLPLCRFRQGKDCLLQSRPATANSNRRTALGVTSLAKNVT